MKFFFHLYLLLYYSYVTIYF